MPSLAQRLRQNLAPIKPVVVYSDETLRTPIPANWVAQRTDESEPAGWHNLTLSSYLSSDLLQAELQQAMSVPPYQTYPLGLDPQARAATLSAQVADVQPCRLDATKPFTIDVIIPRTRINVKAIPPILPVRVMGMNYSDHIWRQIGLPGTVAAANATAKRDSQKLPKAYSKTAAEWGDTPAVHGASFWDLIYVVLQPPINLGQLENLFFPHELYGYQQAGIEFLMRNDSALLADEMGTGKTVMTTVALRLLFQQGKIQRVLILAPLSVLRVWQRHLEDWSPELLTTFVRGTADVRQQDWKMPAHVYVTTYDTLRSDIDNGNLPASQLARFDVIALDEAQAIKNPASGRSKAIKRLRASQRWALTGTPIENRVEDVAAIFDFLRPGYISSFDLYPAGIKAKIAPYFLRRRKADVLKELPEMIKQDIWLDLDKQQRVAYEAVLAGARSELTAMGAKVTRMAIFAQLMKLKQICNFGPGQATSPKVDQLKEQIEDVVDSGQKVIVFSQFIGEGVNKLEPALKAYGTAKLIGEQSEIKRNQEIDRFRKSADVPILLASVKTGGVGLTLTEASYVVHFDHWWNPAIMWQAEARVHRPGQTRGVNVYSYWMADTIEVKIHQILQKKGLLFQDVIEALSEEDVTELISTEEWLDMFGIKSKGTAVPSEQPGASAAQLTLGEIRTKLYDVSPARFEQIVKSLMQAFGYPNVRVTGHPGDGGIDVRSTRNTKDGQRHAIAQCKRYKGAVGVDAARSLLGVMTADASIEKAYLVTTGEFSADCLRFCQPLSQIELIPGAKMAMYVKQFGLEI